MDYSRRDLFRVFLNPGIGDKSARRAALPDGVDILLDKEACTAWGRGICTRCREACGENAIYFAGMMNPRVLAHRCTLCGDCVPVCPQDAITVRDGAPARGDREPTS